ncbi:UNVERIFIED_CONTAM: hypothetical protein HDU68_001573 [Siphonaria sp. JEL0065]|nr:hypothetical protein HDU68_001573 [Siphonaria sp. JEL0065]
MQFTSPLATLDALLLATSDSSTPQSEYEKLFSDLIAQQQALSHQAATTLKSHQTKQSILEAKKNQVQQLHAQIFTLVSTLVVQKQRLEKVLDSANKAKLKKKEQTPLDPSNLAAIVNYSRRLSKFTAPPLNPAIPSMPPIPQDAHMKRSLLFAADYQSELVADKNGLVHADTVGGLTDTSEALMEMDFMAQLVQNPAHASTATADGDEMDEEDELNLDL